LRDGGLNEHVFPTLTEARATIERGATITIIVALIINLFIFPADRAEDTSPIEQVRAGYNIVDWTKSGMMYWAVFSLNAAELQQFAQLVREESPTASRPGR
jgi:anti-sigma factor RsiW